MEKQIKKFKLITMISLFLGIIFTMRTVYSYYNPDTFSWEIAIYNTMTNYLTYLILTVFFYIVTMVSYMHTMHIELIQQLYQSKEDK